MEYREDHNISWFFLSLGDLNELGRNSTDFPQTRRWKLQRLVVLQFSLVLRGTNRPPQNCHFPPAGNLQEKLGRMSSPLPFLHVHGYTMERSLRGYRPESFVRSGTAQWRHGGSENPGKAGTSCHVSGLFLPGALWPSPRSLKMKVHPEMLMKTKEEVSGARYQVARQNHEFVVWDHPAFKTSDPARRRHSDS